MTNRRQQLVDKDGLLWQQVGHNADRTLLYWDELNGQEAPEFVNQVGNAVVVGTQHRNE